MNYDDKELDEAYRFLGITDPEEKKIVFDYISTLFRIAIEQALKQDENEHPH